MTDRRDLIQRIWDDGAIWFANPGDALRRLKKHADYPDAPESPYFISLRAPDASAEHEGTLTQGTVDEIGRQLWEEYKARGLTARFIAPIPAAALAYGEAMVSAAADDEFELRVVELIKLGEGANRRIAGVKSGGWQQGDEVVLVDDLITAAGTKKEAVDVLRDTRLDINTLLVVIDREQGGIAEMDRMGVRTFPLLTWSGMVDVLNHQGVITDDQLAAYHQYLADDRAYDQQHGLR